MGEKIHRNELSQRLVAYESPTSNDMVNRQQIRNSSPKRFHPKLVVSPPLYEGVEQGQTCPTIETFLLSEDIRTASKSVKELILIEQ